MAHKKVLTIQDISCTGRCSITVALPILSACGIETAILPTSVLSTHTGGFTDYYHCDLTDGMSEIAKHWKKLDLHFDAIYVGFLANARQVDEAIQLIKEFASDDTIVFVDPAMADDGELYSLLPLDFPAHMCRLCQMADVIVPNMTEAFMLLGEDYREGPYTEREVEDIIMRLSGIHRSQVIITGVNMDEVQMSVVSYHPGSQEFHEYACKRVEGTFYGTGDVFMSAFIGAMLNDKTIPDSIDIASEYVLDCIENTVTEEDYRYGVNFETEIPLLLGLLGKLHWS